MSSIHYLSYTRSKLFVLTRLVEHTCIKPAIKIIGIAVQVTALHQGSSKYLTAQDTQSTPTLTKHDKTHGRFGELVSLQPQSKIQINRNFSVSSIELIDQKLRKAMIW